MSAPSTTPPAERGSFLATPGDVGDWRLVTMLDAAHETGLAAHLPGQPADVASRAGLEAEPVRVLLEALAVFGVVRRDGDGTYHWDAAPDDGEVAVVRHHARALRRWSTGLADRLRGSDPGSSRPQDLDVFLPALAVQARERAGPLVDRCLTRFPRARRVADLGGGHGEYALEFARRGLEVTLQDVPAVVDWLRARGTVEPDGVTLFAGDFHVTLPDGPFDLVLLAGVTHIFAGADLRDLFARLRPRVSDDGGLAISTMVRGDHVVAPLFAVQMLLNGRGGDTHAQSDYRRWLAEAGFADITTTSLDDGPTTLLCAGAPPAAT